jgi:DNA repair protein RecO (recombination protein O)
MAPVKSRAIVLRSYKLGETSKLVVCYTRDYGKVRLVAKGGRKGGGRFGAALEPLMVSRVVFYLKEGRGLSLLSEAGIEREFPSMRRDVVRMAYGSAVVELIDRLIHERESDSGLFDNVERSLAEMDQADEEQLDDVLWRFELSLAAALGYSPELSRCVQCGSADGRVAGFSSRLGGLVCARCAASGPGTALTTVSVAELLRLIAADVRSGSASGVGVRLTRAERDVVTRTLHEFLEEQGGQRLRIKSMDFLAQIRRLESGGTETGQDND